MKVDLTVMRGNVIYYPAVAEGIELALERSGTPGKLTFSAVEDDTLTLTEGDACKLTVDGEDVFFGYIFTKKRGKERLAEITAYDQLRYLTNKEVFSYENKTATEIIRMLAEDFRLKTGQMEDTAHKLPYRLENNLTLFDIINNALDETLAATGKLYVLYDNVGALALRDIENMKLDYLLDAETLESFDYQSSIDDRSYNQIKVVQEESGSGNRSVFVAKDQNNIDAWGVLQMLEQTDSTADSKARAAALLELYNRKTKTLTVAGALGRCDVRAGCMVIVRLDLGDILLSNYMVVESVRHTWNEQQHLMQLKLRGGDFVV